MDRRQKSTLRDHHTDLANELILDVGFYAALRQKKIFTDGMIQIIKDERKPRDQVYKMLELLEKRGPDAFENFVRVVRVDFNWIAEQLEETYEMKGHRERSSHHLRHRVVSTPQETTTRVYFKSDPAPETSNHNRGDEDNDNNNDDNVDKQYGGAVKQSSSTKHASEMKTMVKQFADKFISPNQIIKSPWKPLSPSVTQIQEDTESEEASIFDDNGSDISDFNELDSGDNNEPEDGESFYAKIKRKREVNESCNNDVDGGPTQDEEYSEIQDMYMKLLDATNTLKPDMDISQMGIRYKMINELIDKLVEDKQAGEDNTKMVKKCLGLFPEKDRKFPLNKNIENLQKRKRDIKNEWLKVVDDLYQHSQDRFHIIRMKEMINHLEKENSLLQMKKSNLENDAQAKDNRISDLEKKMKLFDEKQQKSTEKKPLPARRRPQRRIVPGAQSPRKRCLGPGSQMGDLRSPYTGDKASPRPGASSARKRQNPKR